MRQRIWDALVDQRVPTKRLNRFDGCGNDAWVVRSIEDPDRLKVAANTCHDRWCIPCQRDRSHVLARNVLALVDGKRTRMITLTLRADTTSLAQRLDRIHKCFLRLRKTLLWTHAVTGGASFIEVKFNPDRQSWHAHMHLLVVGSYIPKVELSNTWLRITGDSCVTDIRLANSPEHAAKYVTKYVSKPFDAELTRDAPRLREAVTALQGVKMCVTFGSFRGKLLTATPDDGSWEYVASLDDLLKRARAGDATACDVVRQLNQNAVHAAIPLLGELNLPPPPKRIPNITKQTLLFTYHLEP